MLDVIGERIRNSGVYAGSNPFLAQALTADNIEDATATDDVISGQDNPGVTFRWRSVVFVDSDLQGDVPYFAIADVIDSTTGEPRKLTIGGSRVVVTLLRAQEMGWFPFDAYLAEVPLDAGKTALNLVLSPEKVKAT